MEKPLNFKQLYMQNLICETIVADYQKKLQPSMLFQPASLEELYRKHQTNLIEAALIECRQYLDDEAWTKDETFPSIQVLTGEWYLSSVDMQEENGQIRVSILIHFLGHYPKGCAREKIDDYLGMEAWFDYDKSQDVFVFDCFDTASI